MNHSELVHRNEPHDKEMVPRVLLYAVGLLVLLSLLLVSYARLTDRPLEAKPAEGPVALERVISILSDMDGSARVIDENGKIVADLGPSEGGFISGVGRALARERVSENVPEDAPVHLIRYADGRLALRDEFTGWRIELMGFGRDNAAAFSRLLED